ncbi:hypothetical protein PHYBLDRAFT_152903 [Phycomyces blakesleeanus NRRL 1555(-)]|uniref:Uncharacterized protein n=1 Tax=Phycomyces blakesleeanus (strain ATCC 8743b / DSM 1359 / FGSC 10004 / NBRC 33097 / NRRL 1555) TaxID=763407 RepID=A0A162WBN2_PHYB8|nr:hypothetical protein PHYBLDRAFT_152903 [Phycomyces blakesleeanus NRRL 1555(-)]OAD66105.1 hypothetical protein PHYBLDRAFT_152903 [Phycomyces blakesleeanus NRRL 1555(-)]|eukprot:XP_018284145.1 hypothetical protein PHYBLDRAFT_152903 [Phycomyces blakesleeanus NRRL 1555(-)]
MRNESKETQHNTTQHKHSSGLASRDQVFVSREDNTKHKIKAITFLLLKNQKTDSLQFSKAIEISNEHASNLDSQIVLDADIFLSILLKLLSFVNFADSCTNLNCLENMDGSEVMHRLWNRDIASVLNFRYILNNLRCDGTISVRFTRLIRIGRIRRKAEEDLQEGRRLRQRLTRLQRR